MALVADKNTLADADASPSGAKPKLTPYGKTGVTKVEYPSGNIAYRVRTYEGVNEKTGKARQPARTFRTKKEADQYAAKRKTEVAQGTAMVVSKMTVRELMEDWLCMMEKRGKVIPSTLAGYRWQVEKHVAPALGAFLVQRLTTANLQGFYDTLAAHPRTAQLCHLRLKQALAYARRQGWVFRNICDDVDRPSAKPKAIQAWDTAQVKAYLAVSVHDGYWPLWQLALMTGMRRGELVGLRWRDVDLDKKTLSVRQAVVLLKGVPHIQGVKTSASRRTIRLDAATVAALRAHREAQAAHRADTSAWEEHDLVFAARNGKPLDPNHVGRNHRILVKRAKVPYISFHALRHTHATMLFGQGVNVKVISERLGHASIAITLDTYAHLLPEMQEQAVDALDRLFEE